ncbi:MAG: Co2+/Mg2+ efflux protein ApaG [Sandaracinaceae bacterium]
MPLPPTNPSMAVTEGLRVVVESRYLPEQSDARARRYVWAYTVEVHNESEHRWQLLSRHWVITDADGDVEEVRGPGVIGQQPVLAPGEGFRYTSGCALQTPSGSMHGSYRMTRPDGTELDIDIAPFSLRQPATLN